MYNQINLANVLFLDIETVPQYPSHKTVPESWKELWAKKAETLKRSETDNAESLYPRAGIYAEFGKIICISVGFIAWSEGKEVFRMKSFAGDDEAKLLTDFAAMLRTHFNRDTQRLCGHNIKEFDIPYIARRMVINGIELPVLLDISGKKPWEIPHLDTMEMWKFGDYKSYTSLNLLATCLGIPTPKDDIDGSMVHVVYYEERNIERIVRYCQKDVVTVAQVLKKLRREMLLTEDAIHIA